MTTNTTGRWLLAVLALAGLAVAVSAVSAHGTGPTATDAPYNATAGWAEEDVTAAEWAAWMEVHMTTHMGPDAVAWMESQTGLTLEEMAREMAEDGIAGPGPASGYGPGAGYGPRGPASGYGNHGPGHGHGGYGYGGHGMGHGC